MRQQFKIRKFWSLQIEMWAGVLFWITDYENVYFGKPSQTPLRAIMSQRFAFVFLKNKTYQRQATMMWHCRYHLYVVSHIYQSLLVFICFWLLRCVRPRFSRAHSCAMPWPTFLFVASIKFVLVSRVMWVTIYKRNKKVELCTAAFIRASTRDCKHVYEIQIEKSVISPE